MGADEKDEVRFEPLEDHYARDVGYLDDNDPGNYLFKEGRAKDVPCRFHTGFSGTCWKGSNCPYSHEKYTGGYFARDYPELALAASAQREATCITRLAPKPDLDPETVFMCRVTHIVNPSDFYVVPIDGCSCFCTKVEEKIKAFQLVDEKEPIFSMPSQTNEQLEAYTYGFNCLEIPKWVSAQVQPDIAPAPIIHQPGQLHTFLQSGQRYRKYQSDVYFPKSELVAVKVRAEWMRAVVLFFIERDIKKFGMSQVHVQLLDTGEKLTLSCKDVCRLPEKFCNTPAAAFRCCIFGFSPVICWNKAAVESFKELIENRELKLIVKEAAYRNSASLVKNTPNVARLLVVIDGKLTDVSQALIEKGFGLKWNPFPFRPFVKQIVNPLDYFIQHPPPKPGGLPDRTVEIENDRLQFFDVYSYKKLG
ncbi:Tudor domain-containing protein 6 [Orchesella cincta]|uniref:Tudor domain-containing protein 6 n=1 Tax=Orchesella cincta TaxID=48709 RepID=A0A1D2MGG5_ORCCI|nr:Tudor domain-containing protein 6 [Orchesella cincta]